MNTENVTTEVSFDGKNFQKLYVYEIKNLCEEMVRTLLSSDKPDTNNLKQKFNDEYASKCTRFNPSIEFCIHELHMAIKDPLCFGNEEVLISNGKRAYFVSSATYNSEGFDINNINREDIGMPILTDETINYDPTLKNYSTYNNGIIDEDGYIDNSFVENSSSLGEIILMHKLFADKSVYDDYMKTKQFYKSPLEYITSRPNCIAVSKINDKFNLQFVSENDGRVKEFINELTSNDLTDDLPLVGAQNITPMVLPEESEEIDIPIKKAA